MDARTRMFAAATVVAALAAGTLTLAAVRAEEDGTAGAATTGTPTADLDALVRSLGDPDFAAREKAYARLKEAGAAAREALGKGAASEDAQVRWASKRLLGLLEEEGKGDPGARGRLRFEEEEEENLAGEEEREFPLHPGFPFGTGSPDLDRTMEEMRRRMIDLERRFADLRAPDLRFRAGGNSGVVTEKHVVVEKDGERTEVHVGADGKVKVVLGKAGDGKGKEETLEAADAAELEKKHPEVWAKVKDLLGEGGTIRFRFDALPDSPRFPDAPSLGRLFLSPGAPRGGTRGLLGVTVSDLPEVLRAHVKVPAGEGLVVEEVLPGTPAERLGLRRLDLLLSVNGIPVSTAAEVRAAVAAVGEGGALRLRLLREGRETVAEGTR